MKSSEASWNATVFLERLNSFPAPFTVFRILCQPPHHEVRFEGLKEKYFTSEFGEQPVFVLASHAKKNGLNISVCITGGGNTRKQMLKCFYLLRLIVFSFVIESYSSTDFFFRLMIDSRTEWIEQMLVFESRFCIFNQNGNRSDVDLVFFLIP